MTSSAAWDIASAIFGSKPNSLLTSAAAFFNTPKALITGFWREKQTSCIGNHKLW